MACEIGSLGFYYPGPILDACGLVTPKALPFLPGGWVKEEFIRSEKPEWVAGMQGYLPAFVGWMSSNYDIVRREPFPRRVWDRETEVIILRRKSHDTPG